MGMSLESQPTSDAMPVSVANPIKTIPYAVSRAASLILLSIIL